MWQKRCFDIAFSLLFLALLSPLWLAAAAAVWLGSGKPVLFRQERVGIRFSRFQILKFRTMRTGRNGPGVTVRNDIRVTRVGRFLRLTKIDELPQLWNVLRGEMSIVGPRPEVSEFVELYDKRYAKILLVPPGITDLASIRYRDEESILARSQDPLREYKEHILPIKLDLAEQYLQKQSILNDCSIIVQTALATFFPTASGHDE
jgi:lipopolysaccharide/colanic/teichoic acid biosynthesis glycosyltransferase